MTDLSGIAENLPPKSHNNPPTELEYLSENITLRHVALIRQAEEHIQLAGRIPNEFKEDSEANFTSDFIKQVQVSIKFLEKARKDEKEPFLRQGQFVDSFFGEIANKLLEAVNKANRPLNDYLQRKARAEQIKREAEAEALRKEQAAAMAEAAKTSGMQAAKATEIIDHAITMTQVTKVAEQIAAAPITSMASAGTAKSAARLKTEWAATIKDVEQLDLHKLRPYISAAELQKALDRFVKQGGRQCDGASIVETMGVKVK